MKALRRAPHVVDEVAEGRAFLVDDRREELITLNPVGTLVWRTLDGAKDTDALADELLGQLEGVARAELVRDIDAFLGRLVKLGLVVEGGG